MLDPEAAKEYPSPAWPMNSRDAAPSIGSISISQFSVLDADSETVALVYHHVE